MRFRATSFVVLCPLLVAGNCQNSGITAVNATPEASITVPAQAQELSAGVFTALGIAEDPDSTPETLEATWLLDGEEVCPPLAPSADGQTSCEVFFEAGSRSLTLQVRDAQGKSGSASVDVEVQPYGDPWAEIVSPEVGGVYYSDHLIELGGQVGDEADAADALRVWWESSLDGELDVDSEPDASGLVLGSVYLGEGEHQLSLWVENTGLNTAYDSVTISVGGSNTAPSCEILSPESGGEGELGDEVAFSALVDDVDIPEDWLVVTWESDLDGVLRTSAPDSSGNVLFYTDELSVGTHVVTLDVQDEVGATCSTFVAYTVRDCPDLWYQDADGDGYGDAGVSTTGCEIPSGYVADSTDCDDGDAAVNPGATEVCNAVDDDCDGDIDDDDSGLDSGTASTWYTDSDGDGYGDSGSANLACDQPTSSVADATDCDDGDALVNPGATEVCNTVDDDCDGAVDDDDSSLDSSTASTWYTDGDADGYGDSGSSSLACAQPSGAVADATDCDDTAPTTYPGADEYCDGVDSDCDGTLDEQDALDASTWYADADGDGYGDPLSMDYACTASSGYLSDDSDCDDANAAIHPGADEYCDGVDNDCDGVTDEADALDASTWYADADGDGYGDSSSTDQACSAGSGFVGDDTDCDDGDIAVNPDAAEVCDGVDNDCDGDVDEDDADLDTSTLTTWYEDADGDGYGDAAVSSMDACAQPSGMVSDSSDCDDADASVNPAASELCGDSVDEDCDGVAENCPTTTVASADAWLLGETAGDHAGYRVAWAGDQNGDGFDDVLVGAPDESSVYTDEGAVYLVNGPVTGTLDLGSAGLMLRGQRASEQCGLARSAGDTDGDGYDDILLGAHDSDIGVTLGGAAYLFMGPVTADASMSAAYATFYDNDFNAQIGESLGGPGDVNGDGYDDVIIGAHLSDAVPPGGGAAFIFFSPVFGTHSVMDADAIVHGVDSGDRATYNEGVDLCDFDGDGFDDLIIGAPMADDSGHESGAVYTMLGPVSGTRSLSGADGIILAEVASQGLGRVVRNVQDLDGDGNEDFIIGSSYGSALSSSSYSGAVYVFLGPAFGSKSVLAADAILLGESSGEGVGITAAGPGDVDGDGNPDLLIGGQLDDASGTLVGGAYLFTGPVSGTWNLSTADLKILGSTTNDFSSIATAGPGDADGDGLMDVLLGGMYDDTADTDAGAAVLFYSSALGL